MSTLGTPVCMFASLSTDEYEEEQEGRWREKGAVGLYGIVAGWLLVTGSCSVSSAPVIPGNLGHFQPVHM